MAGLTRRRFLQSSGLMASAGTAAALGLLPSRADASTPPGCGGPQVERFGTASRSASLGGMSALNGFGYVTARNQTPTKLGEIDLSTRMFTRFVELPSGHNAWALTTSGGAVYAGTEPEPDLYRFDPQTGEVTLLGRVGPTGGVVWCLTTAPDGTIYAGTYPRGEVWEYSPATGELRNLGVAVEGQQYVRSIAADDTYVFAGTHPIGHIVAFDRGTGERNDITPAGANSAAMYTMTMVGDRLIAANGRQLIDIRTDGSDAMYIPTAEAPIDAMAVALDGTLYATGRPSGSVYRRVDDALVPIAEPAPGDEHRGIAVIDAQTLVGGSSSGIFWWLDLADTTHAGLDLGGTDLAGPEAAQSIAVDERHAVYVAGNHSVSIHDPWKGKATKRLWVDGEPKQMRMVGDRLFAALYPSGVEIIEIDRRGEIRSYGRVANDQLRPLDMDYDPKTGLMLVGTAPQNGQLAGALTLFRPGHDGLEVHRNLLIDQAIASIAVDRGIAYVAGDATGVSVDPTQESATLAAYDIANRTILWETAPIPGYLALFRITVCGGLLYGIYEHENGTWFAMDIKTRTVVRRGMLPSRGEVYTHRGNVYANIAGGSIYHLGPGLDEPRLLLTGLGDGWYNAPQLAFERGGWHAWALADYDLARLRLDPTCPVDRSLRPAPPPPDAILDTREAT